MLVLLLGAHGQLGEELSNILPDSAARWGRGEFDFAQANAGIEKIKEIHPEIIINAAARTNVDACETDQAGADMVNGTVPGQLAKVCAEIGAVFVHVSTDYVFGSDWARNIPYCESDAPGPVNYYGQTKLRGEEAIRASGCAYLIVRTSGLYGGKREQSNYVARMLSAARTQKELSATIDQTYSPTWVYEFARGLWKLAHNGARGIMHMVNTGAVSRFAFTKAIVEYAGISTPVREAKRADFPAPAVRPSYSALASERINLAEYGMSAWDTALKKYIENVP